MELKWKKDKLQVSFQMLRDCWRAWLKEHFTHFNIHLYWKWREKQAWFYDVFCFFCV